MKIFEIDKFNWHKKNVLFPENIQSDFSVLYHGTSSLNEASIDSNGITPSKQMLSRDDIFSVLKSYVCMGWAGETTGGFVVLYSYSKWDHSRSEGNPTFFHYDPVKCLTFATKDYAAGEKIRALRYCGQDLKRLLIDDDIYEKYKQNFNKWKFQAILNAQQIGLSENDIHFHSQEEIEELYNRHLHLWTLSEDVVNKHHHGVIYAVKFDNKTSKDLRNGDSMGILSFSNVSVDQILGKIIVDDETFKSRPASDNFERLMKWIGSDFCKSLQKVKK